MPTSSTIRLICEHPELRDHVRNWLDRSRLAPDAPLTVSLSVGRPAERPDDTRPVFQQPAVDIRSGPPQADVSIAWRIAPALAVLAHRERTAQVTLSEHAVRRLDECLDTFLLTVVVFLLRRGGWHHVHAATAVDPRGRGWLLAGNARSGKSTTAALLASLRWPVGTDDTAFVTSRGDRVTVRGQHAPIALRRGGDALLGKQAGTSMPRRDKVAYWPEDLGGAWTASVDPEVVLLPRVGNGASDIEPVGRREALTELIRWSALVVLEPDLAQEHLDLITQLAKQARSYRITLGRDLFERPSRITELVP